MRPGTLLRLERNFDPTALTFVGREMCRLKAGSIAVFVGHMAGDCWNDDPANPQQFSLSLVIVDGALYYVINYPHEKGEMIVKSVVRSGNHGCFTKDGV